MEEIFHANGNQKEVRVAIFMSAKIDFKTKTVIRNKESHYIKIKGSNQQDNTTFVNIYASNTGGAKHIKQTSTNLKR